MKEEIKLNIIINLNKNEFIIFILLRSNSRIILLIFL